MAGLSTVWLVAVFTAAAAATWAAGGRLSQATDSLDARFGLGDEIGGIVLLAISGTLPELAITVSATASGNLPLAAGNLIGGIAIQTMVLVLCDFAAGDRPLTYLVGRLTPVLEGMLVVIVVSGVLMGTLLKESTTIVAGVSPASLAIVVAWLIGIVAINRVRNNLPWTVEMPGSQPGRRSHATAHPTAAHPFANRSTLAVVGVFAAASIVTLVAGVLLEVAGDDLANRAGINGAIFGATVLAAATALPEVSSGLAAVRLGDNALAIGDIFGGNAFQVTLFLVADLIAGKPVLPSAGRLNSWLASLGVWLTMIYAFAIISRFPRSFLRLGRDSWFVILVFSLGTAGLFVVPH